MEKESMLGQLCEVGPRGRGLLWAASLLENGWQFSHLVCTQVARMGVPLAQRGAGFLGHVGAASPGNC